VAVGADTIREAIRLAARYQLSHWDSLIVAAAMLAGCETLYSEDLQHNQLFEGRLRIIQSIRELILLMSSALLGMPESPERLFIRIYAGRACIPLTSPSLAVDALSEVPKLST
jgi:hypothetical protein